MSNIRRTVSYLKRNGVKKTLYMVRQRLLENAAERDYELVRKKEAATPSVLKEQSEAYGSGGGPVKVSILIPTFETREDFLRQLLDSIIVQSYENFEVCIADASTSRAVANVISEYDDDERIVYKHLSKNLGISGNTNEALKMATGDIVTPVDHDDLIEPDAIFHIVKAFEGGALAAYTDEDKVYEGHYYRPHRKSDFNKDLLLSNNYICHLFAVKKEIADKLNGYKSQFDGAQDYDFVIRCMEYIEEYSRTNGRDMASLFVHIPKVLYHWRNHEGSTAENPDSKKYAYEAGKFAIKEYLERNEIAARVVHSDHLGFYRINYEKYDKIESVEFFEAGKKLDEKELDEKTKEQICSYFVRSDVKMVCPRVVNSKGVVSDNSIYSGMKKWDSGLMHRAHLVQDLEKVALIYAVNTNSKGELIVYDPEIVIRK